MAVQGADRRPVTGAPAPRGRAAAPPPVAAPAAPAPGAAPRRPGRLGRLARRLLPRLTYRGFVFFSRLSAILPLRISYAIAVLIGDFIYFTWREHSGNAVSNMRRVLGATAGERAVRRAARQSFRNYAKTLLDFIRMPHTSAAEIQRRVRGPHGLEHVDEGRVAGKGVIVVSGHVGNWDLGGALLGLNNLPVYAVADRLEPPQLDALVVGTRERNGIRIIQMEASATRLIFESLRRNEVLTLLVDRPMPGEGVPVEFFGETAWLPSGPAAIALKTGAALLVGYCFRLPGDIPFRGAFEAPLAYKHLLTGNKQADIGIITQCIATAVEELIRRVPEQWYMFRPMWPRVVTPAERRRARRRWRRQLLRARARQSLGRLRRRRRGGAARGEALDGLAVGISVDPPEVEEWVQRKGDEAP